MVVCILSRIDRVSAENGTLRVKAKVDGVNDLNVVNRGKTNLHRLISLMREPASEIGRRSQRIGRRCTAALVSDRGGTGEYCRVIRRCAYTWIE